MTRATITGLLDGLERDGFVARRTSLDGRRRITVVLTEHGRKTTHELLDSHNTWIASLFGEFTTNDLQTLHALLRRIWKNLDAGEKPEERQEPRS